MDDSDVSSSRSPKRRRITPTSPSNRSKAYKLESRYSSPDELAGSSDDYSAHKQPRRRSSTTQLNRERERRQSYENGMVSGGAAVDAEEDSPDELDHTAHTFYGRGSRGGEERNGPREVDMRSEGDDVLDGREEDEDGDDEVDGEDVCLDTPGIGRLQEDEEEERKRRLEQEAIIKEKERSRMRKYKLKMVLRGHRRGVASVKFSPDGKMIASCSADATVRIWDVRSGKVLHLLEGHLAGISTIAWSPDSKILASGSDDKSIWLWNATTGKPYRTQLLGHQNYIYSIAFSPKGNMIVSGSYDEAVFLWDVRGARVMRSLPAHSDPVGGVDFIRDGTLIASCASDGLIRIWDTATGQCLRTLVHEDNAPVSSVRFSTNGKYVLAWTLDSCVRLWNYVEGKCVKTYQGHVNVKYSMSGAFGVYGDGSQAFVASGSEDGSILLWDVTSKEILQKWEAHDGVVLGLDTKPGLVVSGGMDGMIRVWDTEADEDEEEDEEMEDNKDDVKQESRGQEQEASVEEMFVDDDQAN